MRGANTLLLSLTQTCLFLIPNTFPLPYPSVLSQHVQDSHPQTTRPSLESFHLSSCTPCAQQKTQGRKFICDHGVCGPILLSIVPGISCASSYSVLQEKPCFCGEQVFGSPLDAKVSAVLDS